MSQSHTRHTCSSTRRHSHPTSLNASRDWVTAVLSPKAYNSRDQVHSPISLAQHIPSSPSYSTATCPRRNTSQPPHEAFTKGYTPSARMGFHIPDSPSRRTTTSASSQTTTASQASDAADANAVQFSERFSSRRIVSRRNALVPTLFIDVVGSPRSPFVCLSRDHRTALSRQHEQAQQTSLFVSHSIDSASGDDSSSDSNSRNRDVVKRAPGILRRSDQRDADIDASFASRASLNVHDTP